MKKTNIIWRSMVLIVVLLSIMPLVQALGITPGRKTINFEENLEREVKFKVLNNENKDVKLAIYARGSLAEYIEIPIKEILLKAGEDSKELSYKIKLPAKIEEPGLHAAEIVVREVTVGKGESEISVGAMQAVITQLHVYVPYPGKYVVAKLDIVGGKLDKRTMFFVPLINFGEEDVRSAKAEIIVMDMYEKVINKVETNELPVPGEGRAELSAQMDPSFLLPGVYRVVAKVEYDGLTTTAENTIYIRDFLLIPLDISVRDFSLGEIAKFNILVENIGNIKIEDATSLLSLYSKSGITVANVRSAAIDFEPFEKKEMVGYWETGDVKADEYSGKVILKYGDKSDERDVVTLVGKDFIQVEIIGVTGYAIGPERAAPLGISPIAIVAVLLALVNIGWFVFYFISKRKNEQ
jgi:hypothetical protein